MRRIGKAAVVSGALILVGIAMAAESGAPVLSTLHRHFLSGEIQQLSMDERLLRVADGVFTCMSMANNFDPPSANKIDPPGATKNQLSRLCFSR